MEIMEMKLNRHLKIIKINILIEVKVILINVCKYFKTIVKNILKTTYNNMITLFLYKHQHTKNANSIISYFVIGKI